METLALAARPALSASNEPMIDAESPNALTAGHLAGLVDGKWKTGFEASPADRFDAVQGLPEAQPNHLSFIGNETHLAAAEESHAGAILCHAKLVDALAERLSNRSIKDRRPALLVVPNVWTALVTVLNTLFPPPVASGQRHPTAVIDATAHVHPSVDVGPQVVIGPGCSIEEGCRLEANVVVGRFVRIAAFTHLLAGTLVHDRSVIGARCTIGPGAVIGSRGFKYEIVGGVRTHIPQVGKVVIEDDVSIGANSTIDRAGFGETRIGARTKIDNLVQVAHNVTIGPDCVLCAQVGVAGSSTLGRGVIMAGQSAVADHVHLADGVVALAQSGIARDVENPGTQMMGSPANPAPLQRRNHVAMGQLSDMIKRLATLEKGLAEFSAKYAKKDPAAPSDPASDSPKPD